MQAIQLKEVDCPFIKNQWISFFTWMTINWERALLRISPEKCTFENYHWEEISLWGNEFQLIKNIYWSYDILNLTTWTLYNLQATKLETKSRFSLRFFLDNEQKNFVDFDWKEFWKIQELDTSREIDLSDADDTTLKPVFH